MFDVGGGFLAAVEREPSAEAIVDGDRRLDYESWLALICKVAGGLRDAGVGRGDRLVAVLQNNLEMATLHWACQLAGIVVTPLNWRAKPEELNHVLLDADPKAIIYQDVSAQAVSGAPAAANRPCIALRGVPDAALSFDDLSAAAPVVPQALASPEDISIMLYTSGTTGRGKGVPRTHYSERSAAIAHVAQNLYRFGERTLGVMPLYHTMGVRSLLAMSAINGCFVCQPRFDAGQALSLIEREQITNLYLVPTLYHDLLTHHDFSAQTVSSVLKLGFAGASMTDGLLKRIDETFAPELFVNHYGSSEIYTFTICQNAAGKPGSAGKAGLNQRIRVVRIGSTDSEDRVSPGEEGQIIAALDGDEAFAGYWQRPDADAKALHEGWYFTGDIGYTDEDGDLFVTGRVDDMVISGGENVLPAEIESVLSLHPAVAEVAVAGLPDERLGQKVAAFVVAKGEIDAASLDAYCRSSDLANFKRPRAYVFVDEIPKSVVGKILRRQLRDGHYRERPPSTPTQT